MPCKAILYFTNLSFCAIIECNKAGPKNSMTLHQRYKSRNQVECIVTKYSKVHLKGTNIRQWIECIITTSPRTSGQSCGGRRTNSCCCKSVALIVFSAFGTFRAAIKFGLIFSLTALNLGNLI